MVATLMKHYHQPYSEIENMSMEDAVFFSCLLEAENVYIEQEYKKMENQINSKGIK